MVVWRTRLTALESHADTIRASGWALLRLQTACGNDFSGSNASLARDPTALISRSEDDYITKQPVLRAACVRHRPTGLTDRTPDTYANAPPPRRRGLPGAMSRLCADAHRDSRRECRARCQKHQWPT